VGAGGAASRLALAEGESKYDEFATRLAAGPVIMEEEGVQLVAPVSTNAGDTQRSQERRSCMTWI